MSLLISALQGSEGTHHDRKRLGKTVGTL
jgi:hypothetical protein